MKSDEVLKGLGCWGGFGVRGVWRGGGKRTGEGRGVTIILYMISSNQYKKSGSPSQPFSPCENQTFLTGHRNSTRC